jgi:DNA repair protein RadA/Sms
MSASKSTIGAVARPQNLLDSSEVFAPRFSSGDVEFDEVLGGGFVPGALVLLGGDPGIGKSTLALQTALRLSLQGVNVLYISGEESVQQIRLRATRIDKSVDLQVLADTNLDSILANLEAHHPALAVVDSIQTITSDAVNGVVGGVSQVAYATNSLMRLAKSLHITLLVIGHVTKEGMLAGPKTLEHMVDTVLYLEGERFTTLRLLRCNKNRFGSTGEVGVFEMLDTGLAQVSNPGALFLEHRSGSVPGTCVTAILEGNKVLLLEVQALTNTSAFGYPKRAASGFDVNRLQLLVAIMEKRLGAKLQNQDIYINVAGGFELDERAADLPVVLAVLSSLYSKPLPATLVAFAEVGLAGEVRMVTQLDKRIKEAAKLGFNEIWTAKQKDKTVRAGVNGLGSITELSKIFKD